MTNIFLFRFESVKKSGNYLIHRREQKMSGGSVATLSGRGPPPLHIFPIPGIYWSPLNVVNKNNSISTFSLGSAF